MKKFFKKLAIVLLILIGVLLLTTWIITALFEEQVGRRIVKEVNKSIRSELTVGNFDLSIFSTFPNAAVNLRNVVLKDTKGGVLLEADKVSCRFGLLSLFGSDIKVRSIVVSDGALTLASDERGRANYDIAAGSSDSGEDSGAGFSLETATLEDIELIYSDLQAAQEIMAQVGEAHFSGKFSSGQFTLGSEADLTVHFADLGGARFLAGKALKYKAKLAVNATKGVYQLEDVQLQAETNRFDVKGVVERRNPGTYYDLAINGEDCTLESMMQLLPETYLEKMGTWTSTGNFVVKATVKGVSRLNTQPAVKAELRLDKGVVSSPQMQGDLKDIAFAATFDNGAAKSDSSSVFEIKNLRGYYNGEPMELRLRVENLEDPLIDFAANGVLPMPVVNGLMAMPKVTDASGEVEVKNVAFKGRYADMMAMQRDSLALRAQGEVVFDDAAVKVNGEQVLIDRGRVYLKNDSVFVEDVVVMGPDSDLAFNGSAAHVIPYLLSDTTQQKVKLEFALDMRASNLDLDRLLAISDVTEAQAVAENTTLDSLIIEQNQTRERITDLLKGVVTLHVGQLNYELVTGSNFSGELKLDNNALDVKGSANSMSGSIDLDGTFLFQERPSLVARVGCKDISVNEFFRQMENFGQEVLQDQHLRGGLTAKFAIYAYWDETGNFLMNDLHVLADATINNGELIGFKMLENFSTFVKMKDLRHIKFVTLQNFIEVKDGKLYLPAMFIQSNAMNLTVSGEHAFAGDMKYNVKVNAGQVLINRLKGHDAQLKPQKARKNGFFNLYYTIFGTNDETSFKSAKKEVKADFEFSEKRKQEIAQALKEELGSNVRKLEEPTEWKDGG
ncbi:MAG: hypothetical protein HUU01_06970 [Saprospiraceae bacterium]|nr:hypothetical protein [Saprospiraceae bacterium]